MRILVVDDEAGVRKTIMSFLTLRDCETEGAESRDAGMAAFRNRPFDAVISDVYLGPDSGLDLLCDIMAESRDTPVVMISGHADIQTALKAMRQGAADFLEKPLNHDRLEAVVESLRQRMDLKRRAEARDERWLETNIAGRDSGCMKDALALAKRAGESRLNVLVEGQSGTGKELFARYIHYCSDRSDKPLLTVNCAAIPQELVESVLFGVRKGAFTGAVADKPGLFKVAGQGTLFLDEIGELPLGLQSKLLRAIEYGEFFPVGATSAETSDVRLVSATNRELASNPSVFREDLFFRISQVRIRVPSLAERKEDIPALSRRFLDQENERDGTRRTISAQAVEWLASRDYPGNVRELRNSIMRACAMSSDEELTRESFLDPDALSVTAPQPSPAEGSMAEGKGTVPGSVDLGTIPVTDLRSAKREMAKRYIGEVLRVSGNLKDAAETLGILPNNLSREMKNLSVRKPG